MHGRIALATLAAALLAAAPAAADIPAGNLVVNPGAEAAAGGPAGEQVPLPGWTVESTFTAVQYGAPEFLTDADGAALGGGENFFAGGPGGATSAATQTIDVSAAAAEIDAGQVAATLSALLGGWDGQDDQATVTATALSAAGAPVGGVALPAVTMAERNQVTTLLPRTANLSVPAGTRSIRVRIDAVRSAGSYNDGYADNVNFTFAGGTPVFHKRVVVEQVSGTVRFRAPGSSRFVTLDGSRAIPLGSTIDTKRGRIELTSVPKAGGTPEKAQFYDGIFVVRQPGAITELTLSEALAPCKQARAAASKPKSRRLWGDGKGSFRTRGKYSAATVRGTKWLVQDSCAGTLTRVTQGSVSVRDAVRKRTVIVRAGGRYTARPRR